MINSPEDRGEFRLEKRFSFCLFYPCSNQRFCTEFGRFQILTHRELSGLLFAIVSAPSTKRENPSTYANLFRVACSALYKR